MTTKTLWQEFEVSKLDALEGDHESDVAIIGGGLTGITTAYLLSKAGKRVIVVDKASLDQSVTAYTTAFLTRVIDTDLTDLVHMFSETEAKQILASHEHAIDSIEKIITEEKIDCDFSRVPHYNVAFSKHGYKQFESEAALSNKLGFIMEAVAKEKWAFPNDGAFLEPDQALFHPLKYALALRNKAIALGAQFFDASEALDISGGEAGQPARVRLERGSIIAASVVIATYNPVFQPLSYRLKKGMYKSYVYDIRIPSGTVPYGLYEDDANPYHYFRVEKDSESEDRMIIGGEDHRKEFPIDEQRGFNALKDFIENTLGIKKYTIAHRWTGPILEQTDGIALIGPYSKHFSSRYVATAFSGNGMTYATLAGLIISDEILGNKNEFAALYDPSRSINLSDIIRKGRDYTGELIHGLATLLSHSKK